MTSRRACLLSGLAWCATTAIAWHGGMAVAGWTGADAPRVAQAFLLDHDVRDFPGVYLVKEQVRKQLQAMTGPGRAQVVKEL